MKPYNRIQVMVVNNEEYYYKGNGECYFRIDKNHALTGLSDGEFIMDKVDDSSFLPDRYHISPIENFLAASQPASIN